MAKSLGEMTNEELWALFPIVLAPHDPRWNERYVAEADRIVAALGQDQVARISHIGSTAVSGLVAKPTIDILLEVVPDTDVAAIDAAFASVGFGVSPQPNHPAPHRMYLKGYTPEGFRGQVFHVHVRHPGDWDEYYFRDWLQEHPDTAKAYAALKQELIQTYKHDRDGYTDRKTAFVREMTARARAAYGPRYLPSPVVGES